MLKKQLERFGLGIAFALSGPVFGALVQGCSSSDKDATSGHRVVLHTQVALEPTTSAPFTTGVGWTVALDKALVSTGAFYYFDGPPPLVAAPRHHDWRFAQWLGLGTAHAHPGHYQAGNSLGQMLEASSADLLAGTASYPDGEGVSGIYRSGRFSFSSPPVGPAAAALGAHVAIAEGHADMAGQETHYFRAIADLSDIEEHATGGNIDGCEFAETDVETDGTVTVTVHPEIWFELVDFTTADVGAAGAPVEFTAGTQAQIAFVLGVTQLSAYKFSFASP